jgi:serine phosphatase RsbU (regulator of sigma subunit)
MEKTKNRLGIIPQVAVLFIIGILATGLLTYFSQRSSSEENIERQMEDLCIEISNEVRLAITEYPAEKWLVDYWYQNSDALEIPYDEVFGAGTRTEELVREFSARHPEIQIKYADEETIRSLPEEDQKLYAEIAYSWLITRINEIKRAHHVEYLFCVVTDNAFQSQFFLLSAAEVGSIRGTKYEQVYPLGHVVEVSPSQQAAMRVAVKRQGYLADAGSYMDYYYYMGDTADWDHVLVGMTYGKAHIRENISASTRQGTTLAVTLQLILSAICLGLIYLFVLRPLRTVQENIRLYKDTKDSGAVVSSLSRITAHNEIGQLSEDVKGLALEIDDYLRRIEVITAEEERIGAELSLATRIQAAFIPHIFPPFPERREFSLYASMEPAREVGGDFYDFFLIDSDHLGLVVADVSGKGIPAALFMMVSKIILQSVAMLGRSPAEILTKTNEAICSGNTEDMFVTVWLGILEISTGTLTAANAGHEYPVLKRPDGGFELIRDRHGLVIGGLPGTKYKEYELRLEPGAKLFLYTDGVPEATDADNNLFGTERMLAALNDSADGTPGEILRGVRRAVDGFVKEAEQFDDLTMMCLTYHGPEEKA